MPNKPKPLSRTNSATPASMSMESRGSRKESVELIDESMEACDEEEFDETGEKNVRFKVRGLFMRVNIFGDF